MKRQLIILILHHLRFFTFLLIYDTFHIYRLSGAIDSPVSQQCHMRLGIFLMNIRLVAQIHILLQHSAIVTLTRHILRIAIVGTLEHLASIGTRNHLVKFLIMRPISTIEGHFHSTNRLSCLTVKCHHLCIAIS